MKLNRFYLFLLIGVLCTGHLFGMKREERTEPDFDEIMRVTSERNARIVSCNISDSEGKQYIELLKVPGRSEEGNYVRYSLKTGSNERLHLIKMITGQHASRVVIQRNGYREDFTAKCRILIDQADALLPNI